MTVRYVVSWNRINATRASINASIDERQIMRNLSSLPEMILLAIVVLFIVACDKEKIDVRHNITGDWRVISFEDHETSTVITKTEENTWSQFNNGDITVSFTETDLTSGVISGIKVTNSFSGDYTIDNKGGITISNLFQTLINEPEWGRLFDSIRDAESYELRNRRLVIHCNQRKSSITLERLNE